MWEIAAKSFRTEDGRTVDVEHASDAEFQAWIQSHGIPVDEEGIPEWGFEDRIGVIRHAIRYGIELKFSEEKDFQTLLETEVFGSDESASQAV